MNVFDLIILAILIALTLRGIWKGMISQIVSVASYFVCWIVATRFGGLVAPSIPVEAPWNQVLAMAVIFLMTLVAIRFASSALEKLIKHWNLQKLNTLFGGLLGFAKGLLLCMIITFFAVMFSETSRTVVFNSISGFRLAQLITQVGLFVPEDSYEFIHSQLAQFQNKVDEAAPGQTPDTLSIQSSETIQQMLTQLHRTKAGTNTNAGSLWTALTKWWNGTKGDNETPQPTDSSATTLQSDPGTSLQNSEFGLPLATTYAHPPSPPFVQSINTYADVPQSVATQPPKVSDDIFIKRTEPSAPLEMPQLQAIALLPPPPAITEPLTTLSAPLTALAPLTESLAMLPEPSQTLPTLSAPDHVGSDLLLRNSALQANPHSSAKVYRPR